MTGELPRILIIDDEKDNLEALKRLLRRDYHIDAFLSAEEALEYLRNQQPALDAVVSDQRMPGMSGSEFFGKLLEVNPHPTRILLTGFADLEAIIDAVNRGHIWRYVAKPWEPDDLKLTLKQAVERTRLQRSLKESNRSLERALQSMKAKDWSRERLLKILLHEFRTIPQILDGVLELEKGPDAASEESRSARQSFLARLHSRVQNLASEIEGLFSDEQRISKVPQENFYLSQVLGGSPPEDEPEITGPRSEIREALHVIAAALAKNNLRAPVSQRIDFFRGPKGGTLFLSFLLRAEQILLPAGLSEQNLDAATAWPALLEPFVGIDDFQHHSTGLRLDLSRKIRLLMALGIKADFDIQHGGKSVELILSFPLDT